MRYCAASAALLWASIWFISAIFVVISLMRAPGSELFCISLPVLLREWTSLKKPMISGPCTGR